MARGGGSTTPHKEDDALQDGQVQHTGAQSVEEASYPNPEEIAECRSGSDADTEKISPLLWAQHWELAAVVQFVPEMGTCEESQRQGGLPTYSSPP